MERRPEGTSHQRGTPSTLDAQALQEPTRRHRHTTKNIEKLSGIRSRATRWEWSPSICEKHGGRRSARRIRAYSSPPRASGQVARGARRFCKRARPRTGPSNRMLRGTSPRGRPTPSTWTNSMPRFTPKGSDASLHVSAPKRSSGRSRLPPGARIRGPAVARARSGCPPGPMPSRSGRIRSPRPSHRRERPRREAAATSRRDRPRDS